MKERFKYHRLLPSNAVTTGNKSRTRAVAMQILYRLCPMPVGLEERKNVHMVKPERWPPRSEVGPSLLKGYHGIFRDGTRECQEKVPRWARG